MIRALFALAVCLGLTGCLSFLKPATPSSRSFVLTPVPASGASPTGTAVGVGVVKIPAYLFDTSFVVRAKPNEIEQLPGVLWAERLDVGIQRVIAANLGRMIPTDQVRLAPWGPHEVRVAVYVSIERFDVDANGRAELVAWWRLADPSTGGTFKAGEVRLEQSGPAPTPDPAGAVSTLSELLAGLSRELTNGIQQAAAGAAAGTTPH